MSSSKNRPVVLTWLLHRMHRRKRKLIETCCSQRDENDSTQNLLLERDALARQEVSLGRRTAARPKVASRVRATTRPNRATIRPKTGFDSIQNARQNHHIRKIAPRSKPNLQAHISNVLVCQKRPIQHKHGIQLCVVVRSVCDRSLQRYSGGDKALFRSALFIACGNIIVHLGCRAGEDLCETTILNS